MSSIGERLKIPSGRGRSSGGSGSGGSGSGGSGSGGSSSSGGFDAEAFVTRIVEQFEAQTSYHLSSKARTAVIGPARTHRQQINEEVEAKKVSRDEIAEAVITVLRNAMQIAIERKIPMISDQVIAAAMKLECRYFPWC